MTSLSDFLALMRAHRISPSMNQRWRAERRGETLPVDACYDGTDGWVHAGWHPILSALFTDLAAMGWDGHTRQIKEKWGGLEVYAVPSGVPDDQHPAFWARIEQARALAATTCELCGQPGTIEGPTWYRCRCTTCRATESLH